MLIVLGVCVGFVLGTLGTHIFLRKGTVGNLVIADDSDDGPYIFLEIAKTDMWKLRTQTTVKLNIIDKGKIPHK